MAIHAWLPSNKTGFPNTRLFLNNPFFDLARYIPQERKNKKPSTAPEHCTMQHRLRSVPIFFILLAMFISVSPTTCAPVNGEVSRMKSRDRDSRNSLILTNAEEHVARPPSVYSEDYNESVHTAEKQEAIPRNKDSLFSKGTSTLMLALGMAGTV